MFLVGVLILASCDRIVTDQWIQKLLRQYKLSMFNPVTQYLDIKINAYTPAITYLFQIINRTVLLQLIITVCLQLWMQYIAMLWKYVLWRPVLVRTILINHLKGYLIIGYDTNISCIHYYVHHPPYKKHHSRLNHIMIAPFKITQN